jgi:hypothetical protein
MKPLLALLIVLALAACQSAPAPAPTPETPTVAAAASVAPAASTTPSAAPSAAPADAAAPQPASDAAADAPAGGNAHVRVVNDTKEAAAVFATFGSDSVVRPAAWSGFCTRTTPGNCEFPLAAHASQELPTGGQYLNATLTFNHTATCGATKAEVNVNNPKWYDIADVSLVDGYSDEIKIAAVEPGAEAGSTVLGPPVGRDGNERVFGVFPLGCDICVARQNPPCGMKPGKSGCKTGTQYKPDVPCQYQGSVMGGGTSLTVTLVR